MTFTELEILLGIAVGVLLWHITNQNKLIRLLVHDRDTFARFLMKVGDGKGIVIVEDNIYSFKEINNETKSISSI
jgi:hypothetical protein